MHSFSDMCNSDDKILSTDCVISDFTKVPKIPVFGKSLNIEHAIVKKRAWRGVLFLHFLHAFDAIFEKKIDLKKKSTLGKKSIQNPRSPLTFYSYQVLLLSVPAQRVPGLQSERPVQFLA